MFSGLVSMILSPELTSKNLSYHSYYKILREYLKLILFVSSTCMNIFALSMIILKETVKKELTFTWILINSMYQEYHAKYYIPQKILHLKMALIFVLYKCSMGHWNRSRSRQRDGVSHFFTQYNICLC